MSCVQCACIKGEFNISAFAPDCDNLIFLDLSEWMDGDHYLLPKEYEFEIVPPGKTSGPFFSTISGTSTRITREELGFRIMDGVYCIKVTNCGVDYLKRVAIFPELECCITRAKVLLPEKKQEIREIEDLLDSVKYSIEIKDIKVAQSSLEIVKKMVRNLKCDCDCCN